MLSDLSIEAPEGQVRVDTDTQHVYRTVRVGQIDIDGQFQILWSSPEPIKPEIYPMYHDKGEWDKILNKLYVSWGERWAAVQPSSKF